MILKTEKQKGKGMSTEWKWEAQGILQGFIAEFGHHQPHIAIENFNYGQSQIETCDFEDSLQDIFINNYHLNIYI